MNKKGSIIDSEEDAEIRSIAHSNDYSDLKTIFVILFLIVIVVTGIFITNYYINNSKKANITTLDVLSGSVIISNDTEINNKKAKNNSKANYMVTKESSIEYKNNNNTIVSSKIKYNIKYKIISNKYKYNAFSDESSEVLVRFAYSYDRKDWTYITNVIRTSSGNLSPMMGKYFDIAGIEDILNIITDKELVIEGEKEAKIYWKSETLFRGKNESSDNYKAYFYIEFLKND